jgi:chemotaxis protein CheD
MSTADREIVVRMGEFALAREGEVLAAFGLGSCVAVVLSDPVARVGALAHILLPSQALSRRRDHPARSPDTALPLVLARLAAAHTERPRLHARLVGGAAMFADLLPADTVHMGERNVEACRTALRDAGIPILREAVGGRRGRSIWFTPRTDVVTVRLVGGELETL